jgi:hypothetical protein
MANSCQHNGAMTAVRNAQEVFLRPRWFNITRISRRRGSGSSVLSAGCWTARSDIGWWWPSRLVATAAEKSLSFSAANHGQQGKSLGGEAGARLGFACHGGHRDEFRSKAGRLSRPMAPLMPLSA